MYKQLYLFLFIILASVCVAQKKYFQQTVDFTIKVKLDDVNHSLSGSETITYTNHSEQTLNFIYFHLWPNAYKNKQTFLGQQQYKVNRNVTMRAIHDQDLGYIDSLDFNVGGKKLIWKFCGKDSIDMAKIYLDSPLLPEQTVTISTPFFVKIPSSRISRMGHYNQQYFITQWYPKPASFDKNEWHVMPYLENGEYYNEFGTFDVWITLPKNYVVGASGVLQNNPEEVDFMNQKIQETKSKTDFTDYSFPVSSTAFKTLYFRQNNINDFAWFCDKRYNVERKTIQLQQSNRSVTALALYTNEEQITWRNAISFMEDAIQKLSTWHGDYPFDQYTAVEGINSESGSMEYPMIALIGSQATNRELDLELLHEIAHTWFPMLMATNERKDPWIDEGIVSSNQLRYSELKYPEYNFLSELQGFSFFNSQTNSEMDKVKNDKSKKKESRYNYTYGYNYQYQLSQRKNWHQAIRTNSVDFTELNYGRMAYFGSAILFKHLRIYLGNELYDACMLKLYNEYRFKHLDVNAIQLLFENITKKNLSWFFDDLIKTKKTINYRFKGIERRGNAYFLKIKNIGEVSAPLILDALNKKDERVATYVLNGFHSDTVIQLPYLENVSSFAIDYKYNTLESYRKDNYISTAGLFKRIESLSFQPFSYIEKPQKNQIFFSPALGYNVHNGVMLGAAIHNKSIHSKRFEYLILPMYATNSITPVGFANFNYNFNPKHKFQKMELGMDIKSYQAFSARSIVFRTAQIPGGQIVPPGELINILTSGAAINYLRFSPYFDLKVKPFKANSNLSHQLGLKANFVFFNWTADTILNFQNQKLGEKFNRKVFQLHYIFKNRNLRTPFSAHLNTEGFRSSLSGDVYWKFYKYRKGLQVRLFAGTSQQQKINAKVGQIFPFYKLLNNDYGINQKNDYLFEDNYLGRYQTLNTDRTIFTQLLLQGDGNIRMPLYDYLQNIYSTNNVMSTNITLDVPKTWFSFYADFVLDESLRYNAKSKNWNGNYVFGVQAAYKDKFVIFFPIFNSFDESVQYIRKIGFRVNIDLWNPFKLLNREYNDNGR